MSQLDEVSVSIGRMEGKLDSLVYRVAGIEDKLSKKINVHDEHLDIIKNELAEKRGGTMVWASLAGFGVVVLSKIGEYIAKVM